MALDWQDLAALGLSRQFPTVDEPVTPVSALVERMGPIQSQTARSTFLGLGARFPGITKDRISAAFAAEEVVRGSSVRGTIHTATRHQFRAMQTATQLGQRRRWTDQLAMADDLVQPLWQATEHFAVTWRTPAELGEFLAQWLAEHQSVQASQLAGEHPGRYLAFAHGGLIRRPVKGDWAGQGAPEYRAFDLTARHQAAPGLPQSLGVRLLPEFDALLCAYEPSARRRFVEADHHALVFNSNNGLVSPPLLVDGRITGYWRCTGTAMRRPLQVRWFPGTRRPRKSELEGPVQAVEAALAITVTELDLSRA